MKKLSIVALLWCVAINANQFNIINNSGDTVDVFVHTFNGPWVLPYQIGTGLNFNVNLYSMPPGKTVSINTDPYCADSLLVVKSGSYVAQDVAAVFFGTKSYNAAGTQNVIDVLTGKTRPPIPSPIPQPNCPIQIVITKEAGSSYGFVGGYETVVYKAKFLGDDIHPWTCHCPQSPWALPGTSGEYIAWTEPDDSTVDNSCFTVCDGCGLSTAQGLTYKKSYYVLLKDYNAATDTPSHDVSSSIMC